MSQVILTNVFRKDKETKYGIKPQIVIKTEQHGDKWLSSFKTRGTEQWEPGMEVQINVQENGDFMNFTPVISGSQPVAGAPTGDFEKRLKRLEDHVFGGGESRIEDVPEIQTDEDDGLDTGF